MTLTCAMDDSPEIHEGLSASRYALHPLDSRIHASVHDMNSLMGNNQAMSNAKQKAESTGVFLSTLLLLRVFV